MAPQKPSRGVRNNNPGNIEKSRDRWKGLAEAQPDSRFFTFTEARWGIRAMARILQNYQKKYGLDTIEGIISRWAPDNENDTEAYIRAVSRATGFSRDEALDMRRFDHLFPLVKAIIRHENGYAPYADAEIAAGIALSGVAPPAPPKSAASSKPRPAGAAPAASPRGRLKKAANENFDPRKDKKPPARKTAPKRGFHP